MSFLPRKAMINVGESLELVTYKCIRKPILERETYRERVFGMRIGLCGFCRKSPAGWRQLSMDLLVRTIKYKDNPLSVFCSIIAVENLDEIIEPRLIPFFFKNTFFFLFFLTTHFSNSQYQSTFFQFNGLSSNKSLACLSLIFFHTNNDLVICVFLKNV